MLGKKSPCGKRAFISANTHGHVWREMCSGRGVRGLGRRSHELITLCQERQLYHQGHFSPTAPSTFSPFWRTSGSCLACPHSEAIDTCFLLLEGVWPELFLQELSGKTKLYVHFPVEHSPDTEKSLDWFINPLAGVSPRAGIWQCCFLNTAQLSQGPELLPAEAAKVTSKASRMRSLCTV